MNEQADKSAGFGSIGEGDASLDDDGEVGTNALASLAGSVAFVTLGVASDHLRASHSLIIDRTGVVAVNRYAVYSVLRVAMEVSALSWWLVDQKVSPKQRLTRALTAMEDSRRRRQRVEELAGGQKDIPYLAVIREQVEAEARKHRLQKITSRLDSDQEVRVPDAVSLIERQFRDTSDGFEGAALAIYGFLSEPMHGSVLGTMGGFAQPEHETSELRPDVSIPHLVQAAQITGHAVGTAMRSFLAYMGWDIDTWRDLAQPLMDDLDAVNSITKNFLPTPP